MVDGKPSNVTGHLFPGLALQDVADACLILGPEKIAQVDAEIDKGTAYSKELDRRLVAESCLKGRVSWHRLRLPQMQLNPKLWEQPQEQLLR